MSRWALTTSRRESLDGADFVISSVLLYGTDIRVRPQIMARARGVNQAVGCSGGPGGVFRGLKDIPFSLAIARDMEELCPDAWFLDYTNPTTVTPMVMDRATNINFLGLCHNVPHTASQLAKYIGAPLEEIQYWWGGVNHQVWFLRYEWNGEDAYPLIWKAMEDPEIYKQDAVRFEMMKFTNYFVSESSWHNSDFLPWFRRNREIQERYHVWGGQFDWSNPEAPADMDRKAAAKREEIVRMVESSDPLPIQPSDEYCAGIMNSMVTDTPYRCSGRVINTGLIRNLPQGGSVEVPCLTDATGVHPCYIGELPVACAAINQMRVLQDELAVKAVLEQDRWAAEQAIALDPLTASILTLPEIHDLVEDIFREMEPYLWQDFREE